MQIKAGAGKQHPCQVATSKNGYPPEIPCTKALTKKSDLS